MPSPTLNHAPSCSWGWDQYDWECDCGAIPSAAALAPAWIAEGLARQKALAAQPPRHVPPEIKAVAAAMLDPRDPDPTREGIFRDHNCWKCSDGSRPCANGSPNRCEYPRARND